MGKLKAILVALLIVVLLGTMITIANGMITVSGNISSDTTWTLENSPYYVSGTVTIDPGVTLTIEPGVVVKFADSTALAVNGNLIAQGTTDTPVYFTSYYDDTVGGDTNGDGDATAPGPGNWQQIRVGDGGSADLSRIEVRYTGSVSGWGTPNVPGAVRKDGAGNLSLTDSTLTQSYTYGLYVGTTSASHTITSNTIRNNGQHGVNLSGNSAPTITNNTINDNTGRGLYFDASTATTFENNTLSGNALEQVGLSAAKSGYFVPDSNTFSGPLRIEPGNIVEDTVWNTERVYYLPGSITVNSGATLTVDPAIEAVKFADSTALAVNGNLTAQGTTDTPVYFTSYYDDTVGGDTNGDGDATAPGPGNWQQIRVGDGGSADLSRIEVRYTGSVSGWGTPNVPGAVRKDGAGNLSLTDSTLTQSYTYGLYVGTTSASHTIEGNVIENNPYSSGVGLANSGSGVNLTSNTIRNNGQHGVNLSGNSAPTITNNTINNNTGRGLYFDASTATTFENNTLSGNALEQVGLSAAKSGYFVPDSNTFSGPLRIEPGNIVEDTVWNTERVYYLPGSITVNSGATLTVDPAIEAVKFAVGSVKLSVNGNLIANGTTDTPIYFTGIKDDTVGGDTNGDGGATTPAPNNWGEIVVWNNGAADLSHIEVRYAGWGAVGAVRKELDGSLILRDSILTQSGKAGLYINSASASHTIAGNVIENSGESGIRIINAGPGTSINLNTLRGNGLGIDLYSGNPLIEDNAIYLNSGAGIYVTGVSSTPNIFSNEIRSGNVGIKVNDGAQPLIGGSLANGNDIYGNTVYGVENLTATTVTATYNWWGDPSGPYHATTNPSGTGNDVTDYVDYAGFTGASVVDPAPEIDVAPGDHDFGEIAVGASSTAATVTVTNIGTAALNLGTVSLSGADAADFSITNDFISEQTLAMGASRTLWISFAPTSTGAKTADLSVVSDDPDEAVVTLSLSGTGVDVIPPATTLETSPGAPDGAGGWFITAPEITLTRDETGTTYYRFSGDTTQTYSGPFTAPEGQNTLYYMSVDTAGNTETPANEAVIKVDTTDPSDPELVSPSHTVGVPSNNDVIEVEISGATDNLSEVAGYSILWDNSPGTVPDESIEILFGVTQTTSDPLPEGSWHLHLSTVDNAGNRTSTVHLGPFVIDKTKPTGTIKINNDATLTKSTVVTLTLAAADTGSGLDKMRFMNDGGAWSAWQPYAAVAGWNLAAGDGTKKVYAQFKDKAGNESAAVYDTIVLDTTVPDTVKPVASLTSPPVSTKTSKTTTFKVNWSGADSGSGIATYNVRYKLNLGGAWKIWKLNTTANSAYFKGQAGRTYYFQARAKDKAGNLGAWSTAKRTIVPYDNDSLMSARSGFGGFFSKASSAFYLGTLRYSTKKGDSLAYKFTGKSVSLVATKAKNRSKAKIYIDGKYVKTVDAYSSTFKPRQVIFSKAWAKGGTHTIKIVNLGTAGRSRFDVDGLGVGR